MLLEDQYPKVRVASLGIRTCWLGIYSWLAGCSWLLLGCSWLLLAAAGCSLGCSWLPLAAACCSWLFLTHGYCIFRHARPRTILQCWRHRQREYRHLYPKRQCFGWFGLSAKGGREKKEGRVFVPFPQPNVSNDTRHPTTLKNNGWGGRALRYWLPKRRHPIPYTLYPIPYTLHPIPYTLYPYIPIPYIPIP